MRKLLVVLTLFVATLAAADDRNPALTIYNQSFAVVREQVPLELGAGVNTVRFTEVTSMLEPDSVILRDPLGRRALQVL